jgi:SAM-dependent methyltransferase
MKRSESVREGADYGIDTPYVILALAASGLVGLLLALGSNSFRWLLSTSVNLLVIAALWLYCSKVGKLRLREKLLDTLRWNGNETVLDVGCGSGLLLIAAAKRVNDGMAVGVDIWRKSDLSNNRAETTLRNARMEAVADRVRVDEGDVRQLPYGEASFDVVVSLNVLHNIAKREEREKALMEIVRVLKPGGRLLISDFRNVGEYARLLREKGIGDARRTFTGWILFFPTFAAVGSKPLN